MPNSAFGCNNGWDREKPDPLPTSGDAKIATFHFPMKKPELLAKWKKFVNLQDWIPTESSVLCEKHFEPQYIKQGSRTTLKWEQYPIPTIQSNTAQKRPASFSSIEKLRKPPKIRNVYPDQLPQFKDADIISSFEKIDPILHCPPEYEYKKNESSILFYRTIFDAKTGFPSISSAID